MARSLEELLKHQDPEMVARARKKADDMMLDIRLAELPDLAQKKQNDIADVKE